MKKKQYVFNENFDIECYSNENGEIYFNESSTLTKYLFNGSMIPKDEQDVKEMISTIKSAFSKINQKINKGNIKSAIKLYNKCKTKCEKMKSYYEAEQYLQCFSVFKSTLQAIVRSSVEFFILSPIAALIINLAKYLQAENMNTARKEDLKKYAKEILDVTINETKKMGKIIDSLK